MEYDVICSESIDKLVEYVNVYLQDGWQCQGGINPRVELQSILSGGCERKIR